MKRVLFVALGLAACTRADRETPAAKTTDGVSVTTGGAATVPRLLRYHLVKGSKAPLELVMNMEMIAGGRGGKLPTIVLAVDIGVDDVLPDGSAKIRSTITNASTRDRAGSVVPASAMGAMTPALAGIAFTATLSPDGSLHDAKVDSAKPPPAAMATQIDQLAQNLEQVAMRLPDQAIGVGGRWTTRKTVSQHGLDMVTVTTIEITAIDGDKVGFTSTSTVSAPDQSITQDGVAVSIQDVGGGGTGRGTIDLAHMTMTGELTAEFRGTMSAKGQTAPMKAAMAMTLRQL